jgi:hypothetical protein
MRGSADRDPVVMLVRAGREKSNSIGECMPKRIARILLAILALCAIWFGMIAVGAYFFDPAHPNMVMLIGVIGCFLGMSACIEILGKPK